MMKEDHSFAHLHHLQLFSPTFFLSHSASWCVLDLSKKSFFCSCGSCLLYKRTTYMCRQCAEMSLCLAAMRIFHEKIVSWFNVSVGTFILWQPTGASTPRHSPPVRLHVGGASLVVALQRPAVLFGRTVQTTAVPLHQGPAASVGGREVIVALPLRLQTQLVPVVLDVRLLLQSQVHLPLVGRWGSRC